KRHGIFPSSGGENAQTLLFIALQVNEHSTLRGNITGSKTLKMCLRAHLFRTEPACASPSFSSFCWNWCPDLRSCFDRFGWLERCCYRDSSRPSLHCFVIGAAVGHLACCLL